MKQKNINSNNTLKSNMINRKLMTFIIMAFFMISFTPLINANNFGGLQIDCSFTGTYQQGNDMELWQTCDSCTSVTLVSIILPNGTIENYNTAMTKTSTLYNYTYSPELIGKYYYSVTGDKNGVLDEETLCFESTSTGESVNTSQGLVLLAQLGVVALLFGLGRVFDTKKWKIKMLFDMLAALMTMVLINSLKIVSSQSFKLNQMAELSFIIGIVLVGFLFLYLFVYATIEVIQYFKKKKNDRWDIQ